MFLTVAHIDSLSEAGRCLGVGLIDRAKRDHAMIAAGVETLEIAEHVGAAITGISRRRALGNTLGRMHWGSGLNDAFGSATPVELIALLTYWVHRVAAGPAPVNVRIREWSRSIGRRPMSAAL